MKKLLYIVIMTIIFNINLVANDDNKVDCIILEDENSIICKYMTNRISDDKMVTFSWIEPSGVISRTKEVNILAGHGSVYDFRYLKGRTHGIWILKINDGEKEYQTSFTIE